MRDIITKLEELNVEKEQLNEGHMGDEAHKMELDHEVQMARSDLYKAAKYAVSIHKMMKDISEMEGIDGWVASKITKASDYLGSVKHYLEGMKFQDVELAVVPVAGDMTDAMTMDDVNEEEEKEEKPDMDKLLKALKKKLSDEGGAAGFEPLEKIAKDMGVDLTPAMLKGMKGIKMHRDGDYILEQTVDEDVLDEKDEDVIGDIIASLGKMKTPGMMPKPKPKMSTNMKTGATRGAGDDADYMKAAAMANMPDQAKQKMMNKMMVKDSKFSEWGKK
tara:strand:+ start:142 stop:969 length:828 start_codon:yes stop_codon:yes gene_type:complete